MAETRKEARERAMKAHAATIAARDPLAARMQAINAASGRTFGIGVSGGVYQAFETIGRKTQPISGKYATRADCIAFVESFASSN